MNNENKTQEKVRRKGNHPAGTFFAVFFVFFGTLIALSARWGLAKFAGLNMTELVFQLTAPLEGTGNGMVGDYILECLVPSIGAGVLAYVLIRVLRKKKPKLHTRTILLLAGIALGVTGFLMFDRSVHVVQWIRGRFENSDFIEEQYVDPAATEISFPEKKRNLILIYLESMEVSYTDKDDGGAFDVSMIPELTKLAQENEDFSGSSTELDGGYSMPGTTWTMGAMFGTSSGLPLDTALGDSMNNQESFFPNITCLGDILQDEGYHQELLVGSKASFGGRKLFYKDHGDYTIVDYNTALSEGWIPEGYKVWWGFEDEKLFTFAKEQLTLLASGSEPFNFTMLTVDTHSQGGYVCDLCRDEFGDYQYGNVIACSSRQVASFVEWIRQQDFYDNTTVVIIGDHPTMDTGTTARIENGYTRHVYTCYMNAAAAPEDETRRREYSTFDTFPTIIASLGASIDGERLGLGTNLFSSTDTLSEKYGTDYVSAELSVNSDFLATLEKPDEDAQRVIDEFADLKPLDIGVDASRNSITFVVPDVTKTDPAVSSVYVRMWYYKNQTYYHASVKAQKQDDGTYRMSTTKLDLQGTDAFSYQIRIKAGKGTSYVNAGPEGTVPVAH